MKLVKSVLVATFMLWSFVTSAAIYQFDVKIESGMPIAEREILSTRVYGLTGNKLTKTQLLPLKTLMITKQGYGVYTFTLDLSIVSQFEKIIFDSAACIPALTNQQLVDLTIGETTLQPVGRCKDIEFEIDLTQSYCTDWYTNRDDARNEIMQHFNLPECSGLCPVNSSCKAIGLYADAGIGNADLRIERDPYTGMERFCVTPRGNNNWFGRIDCACTVIR